MIPIGMMCLTGYKPKLEILSLALVIARVINLQRAESRTIVPIFSPFYPRVKSTEAGLMLEFLLVSENAST
jgi:hypothetical protein